jgi:hypothetical protein
VIRKWGFKGLFIGVKSGLGSCKKVLKVNFVFCLLSADAITSSTRSVERESGVVFVSLWVMGCFLDILRKSFEIFEGVPPLHLPPLCLHKVPTKCRKNKRRVGPLFSGTGTTKIKTCIYNQMFMNLVVVFLESIVHHHLEPVLVDGIHVVVLLVSTPLLWFRGRGIVGLRTLE